MSGDVVHLKELIRTCTACPAQWEGETTDGRVVYIRYRWGYLTVGIGVDLDEAVDQYDNLFSSEVGGEFDGFMDEDEMLSLTGLTFNKHGCLQ